MATRFEWWMTLIGSLVISETLKLAIVVAAGVEIETSWTLFSGMAIFTIALYVTTTWIYLSISARRLRDRGWSTELIVVGLAGPIAVAVAALFLGLSGSHGVAMALFALGGLWTLWVMIECGFLPSQV
jgi:uncharacterized membrane protein YhaH (DUF805 family)